MQLGMIGLGRMGANMTRRLLSDGHRVVVYDVNPAAVEEAQRHRATGVVSLAELTQRLDRPRVVWMMVPDKFVEQTVVDLMPHLQADDILIDGGNSNYKESRRRAEAAAAQGLHYLDIGTSGGIWGLEKGYCLMVGGPRIAFDRVEPLLKTLAPPDGYAYLGPSGAGHFAKMIHNGIEYGMLQAYGEGFGILQASDYPFDLRQLAHLWNQGSVIRSWLLELAERAFEREPGLESIKGYVEDSGEGRWTVLESIEKDVPAPVLTYSLLARFASRREELFSDKVIAALRQEFGGHAVRRE